MKNFGKSGDAASGRKNDFGRDRDSAAPAAWLLRNREESESRRRLGPGPAKRWSGFADDAIFPVGIYLDQFLLSVRTLANDQPCGCIRLNVVDWQASRQTAARFDAVVFEVLVLKHESVGRVQPRGRVRGCHFSIPSPILTRFGSLEATSAWACVA